MSKSPTRRVLLPPSLTLPRKGGRKQTEPGRATGAPAARPGGGREPTEPGRATGGLGAAFADAPAPSLITRVRTLYEDTVVPVVEIARLAGVTERTIYKYAEKLGWRPRVVRLSRGAGGRFIPLADVGQPVATGLKALDPQAAARAAARCVQAGLIAEDAAAAAVAAARKRAAREVAETKARSRERALAHLSRGLAQIAKIREELRGQAKGGNPRLLGLACRLERALVVHMARVHGRS